MAGKLSDKSFFERVYTIVCQIPYGHVTTYGAIAKCLGSAQSSRMVGWAMNASHTYKHPVPAHRVVNRNGLLTGKQHFETPNLMQQLLEAEGVEVKNNCIVDFENHFWDPKSKSKKYRINKNPAANAKAKKNLPVKGRLRSI